MSTKVEKITKMVLTEMIGEKVKKAQLNATFKLLPESLIEQLEEFAANLKENGAVLPKYEKFVKGKVSLGEAMDEMMGSFLDINVKVALEGIYNSEFFEGVKPEDIISYKSTAELFARQQIQYAMEKYSMGIAEVDPLDLLLEFIEHNYEVGSDIMFADVTVADMLEGYKIESTSALNEKGAASLVSRFKARPSYRFKDAV